MIIKRKSLTSGRSRSIAMGQPRSIGIAHRATGAPGGAYVVTFVVDSIKPADKYRFEVEMSQATIDALAIGAAELIKALPDR